MMTVDLAALTRLLARSGHEATVSVLSV